MRIVAGAFRGRRLLTPRGLHIRPTSDRVREAMFSILAPYLPEARVLDLYAGTGALGLEALSRGAVRSVFVDDHPEALRLIRANVKLCGVEDRAEILSGPVDRVIRRLACRGEGFHLIFLDPPYGKGLLEKSIPELVPLAFPQALAVAEHGAGEVLPECLGDWVRVEERRYGDTMISFYRRDFPS
ncbi:MAG: 16S rRNA (guanine(966)-N(2))-methyltransferase RsmD [Syntrophobacteraceae bacterium]|nr:16S rRNA (guanine(966)-N(2))-methyltransferase RsmD [Syntrophobacteraceae bacterium]